MESHGDNIKWRLQSLLPSDVWQPYQSNQREKIEESQEPAKDAAITVGRHVSPLWGKEWVYRNWGLECTCVEILRGLNWVYFRMFIEL